ncbi:restriction endonuclease subunit S [Corallococcus sp. AB045]|uniref:restriction endonuclease subunit S n=1 Tax=Corallococcus sp. AB045 TaxID=2316719 RepID=UPI000EBC59D4|nr:restriction endonuclease subunit S [Corallococcus sp. AB045]RKH88171.1 restriction endonuclease subunit S [Corallococcus sp. AB045]
MGLKPGYKQTEAGLLPKDWDATRLGAFVKITSGASPSLFRFSGSGIPYFKVEQLSNSEKYLSATDTPYQFERGDTVPANSVVFAKRGAAIALNKVRILKEESFMDTNLMALTPQGGLDCEYLYYALAHIGLWRFADTTSVPQINNKHVKPLPFPLPCPDEQKSIARTLADVDALIEGLDRLIGKKRDIKQAAMQQFLTGQTRLPGFSGEWKFVRLGDHVTFLRNGVNSRAELLPEGSVRYLHYGDIHASGATHLAARDLPFLPSDKASRLDRLRDGDLIFADASEDLEGVSKSVELRDIGDSVEVVSGLHTIAARFDKAILADGFKGLLQCIPMFAAHLRRLAAGTKVYATNRAHVASAEIPLPSTNEQRAVAKVLSDMDAELAALEARRDKTWKLKQAMMQELLTGKTRLVPTGGARV